MTALSGSDLSPARRAGRRSHAAAAGDTWQIAVHTRIEPLAALWRSLEEDGGATVFQSYDWLAVWYATAEKHGLAEPLILTGTRPGAAAPEVILPLCRLRRGGYSLATFPDIMVSDFAGPLFAAGALATAREMRAFWRAARRALPDCDVIHLQKISSSIGARANPLVGLPGIARYLCNVWGMPLEPERVGAPAAIPEAMLASVNKRRAALGRKGRVVSWTEEPAELPALFEELVALRLTRSERIGRDEILLDQAWRDFYAALVARHHERLRVVITRIEVDGTMIATVLGLGYGGAMHYLLPSFMMKKWSRHTPGFQLVLDMMEMSLARGYRYFDFTIGDEPYKAAFGGHATPLYEIMAPLTLRGVPFYLVWRMKLVLRRFPRLQGLLRRLLGRDSGAAAVQET